MHSPLDPLKCSFFPTRSETQLTDATVRLGGRLELTSQLAVGVIGVASWGQATTDVSNIFAVPSSPLGLPFMPPGTHLAQTEDDVSSHSIRLGAGYAPYYDVQFYSDVEYLNIATDLAGSLDVGRLFFGAELHPTSFWTIYSGLSVDTSEKVTLSGAIAPRFSENLSIELGFQHNAFPEIKPEFGTLDFLSLSVVLIW